ncbi:MAG: type II secretion system F family protein [Candidatus Nanoarchaeia archaeon]|nr:type II secretion system F family protein [Candidatus Nanoarchaeia archaeon]
MNREILSGIIGGIAGGVLSLIFIIMSGFSAVNVLFMVMIILIGAIIPYSFFSYVTAQKISKAEDQFPSFLRDISESIRAGMSIPQAIGNAAKTEYVGMTAEIQKMDNMISWGVPFPDAIKSFQKKFERSQYIYRGISIILQSFYAGGKVSDAMDSVADNTTILREVELDRESVLKEQLIIVYVIHLLFVGIIVAMYKILIPLISVGGGAEAGMANFLGEAPDTTYFKTLFLLTISIQSVCNGIVAGVAKSNSVSSGLKHSGVMLAIGLAAYTAFILPSEFVVDVEVSKKVVISGEEVSLSGVVKLDDQPLGNANVVIDIGGSVSEMKTDISGKFSKKFNAPQMIGVLEIKINIFYEEKSAEKVISIAIK